MCAKEGEREGGRGGEGRRKVREGKGGIGREKMGNGEFGEGGEGEERKGER